MKTIEIAHDSDNERVLTLGIFMAKELLNIPIPQDIAGIIDRKILR
jgi:hypothetical protein